VSGSIELRRFTTSTSRYFPRCVGTCFFGLCDVFADIQFGARLEHFAADAFALVIQLGKEILVSVFVEDQFALGWRSRGVAFPVLGKEPI